MAYTNVVEPGHNGSKDLFSAWLNLWVYMECFRDIQGSVKRVASVGIGLQEHLQVCRRGFMYAVHITIASAYNSD